MDAKNYDGVIKCKNDEWFRIKNSNTQKLESFSKRLKRHSVLLKEFLQKHTKLTNLWINRALVFTNKNCELNLESPTVDVKTPNELKLYFKINKARLYDSEIMTIKNSLEELKPIKNTPESTLLKELMKSNFSKNYLNYLVIGLIYGIFYFTSVRIVELIFNLPFFNFTDFLYDILFNGVVIFGIGKIIYDLIKLKFISPIFRFFFISIIGWTPFLLLSWIIGEFDLFAIYNFYFIEIATRFIILFPTVFIYKNLLKKEFPR